MGRDSNSPSGEGALADPVAAWRALDERLREVLADEELAVTVHSNPHTGQAPVAQVIDGYVTPDLVFHGWDLRARAARTLNWTRTTSRVRMPG